MLGLALYFCSINLGAALTATSRSFSASGGKAPMLLHMGCIFAVALFFSLFLRRHFTPPRRLPWFVAAVAFLCLTVPFLTAGESTVSWGFLLPLAVAICLFLPLGLYLFFTAVPAERQGLALGSAIAAGELVWVAVLPLLHLFLSSSHRPEPVLHLFKFLGFCAAGAGACFALTLIGSAAPPPEPAQSAGKPGAGAARLAESVTPAGKRTLGWLFLAGAFYHTLFGLLLLDMPRASDSPHFFEDHYFLLLFLAPVAGFLLDKALSGKNGLPGALESPESRKPRERGLALFVLAGVALPVVLVPVLGFVTGHGLFSGLSVPLLGIRQVFLLTILVVTARLAVRSPYFPLLGSCAWGLMLLHLVGFWLGGLLAAQPVGQHLAAFALAFGCILCLWRFMRIAAALPHLREAPVLRTGDDTPPVPDDPAKLAAFAEAFALSGREVQVLEGAIRDIPLETLRQSLGISESTVRFHQTGLFKKTGQRNRRRLVLFFRAWKPE